MLASGTTTAAGRSDPLERALVAATGGLTAVLLAACGGVLAVRRLGGGFEPLGGGGLVAATALGGGLVLACDAAARFARLPPMWPAVARGGYLLAVAALALPPVRGGGFAIAVAIAGSLVAGPFVGRELPRWLAGRRLRAARARTATASLAPPAATRATDRPRPAAACPGHLLQRFERYELDGLDCLRGTLALAVPQGSRAAHGHVGFCPAFRTVPDVEAYTTFDGVEAVVTAAEIVPWGVRIECRLDEPADEPVEIPVEVFARAAI